MKLRVEQSTNIVCSMVKYSCICSWSIQLQHRHSIIQLCQTLCTIPDSGFAVQFPSSYRGSFADYSATGSLRFEAASQIDAHESMRKRFGSHDYDRRRAGAPYQARRAIHPQCRVSHGSKLAAPIMEHDIRNNGRRHKVKRGTGFYNHTSIHCRSQLT
jgi:hypothetical protein